MLDLYSVFLEDSFFYRFAVVLSFSPRLEQQYRRSGKINPLYA